MNNKKDIQDETLYIVYENGIPYTGHSRKVAYVLPEHAKSVITTTCKDLAKSNYNQKRRDSGYQIPDWEDLQLKEQKRLIQIERDNFEIVEYVPKDKRGE